MKKAFVLSMMSLALVSFTAPVHAEESAKETVKEAGRDVKKGAKKAYRNMKDKTCEMVNGKMECAVKKGVNKAKNAGDEIGDKAEDLTH